MVLNCYSLSPFLSAFSIEPFKCHGAVVSFSDLVSLQLELCFHPYSSTWSPLGVNLTLVVIIDSKLSPSHFPANSPSPQSPNAQNHSLFSWRLACTQQSKDLLKTNIKHIYRECSRIIQWVCRSLFLAQYFICSAQFIIKRLALALDKTSRFGFHVCHQHPFCPRIPQCIYSSCFLGYSWLWHFLRLSLFVICFFLKWVLWGCFALCSSIRVSLVFLVLRLKSALLGDVKW